MCQTFKTALLTCRAGTDVRIINTTSCQHYVKVQSYILSALLVFVQIGYTWAIVITVHNISCHGYCGVCDPSPIAMQILF